MCTRGIKQSPEPKNSTTMTPCPLPVMKFLDPPLILFGTQLIPFMVKLSHFCMCYYACGGKHLRSGIIILMIASSLFIVLHVPVVLLVLGHRHLFHSWAALTENKVPHSRSHTPRFDGWYFYIFLLTLIFLI